jgi:small subunit ribosomal protein S2
MRDMLEAGVHFGHRARFWNPKMAPYIYGEKNDIHIINLEKTLPMFMDSLNYISQLATNRCKILFVGTKRAAQDLVKTYAAECGMPYVDSRWPGGMLTNYKTIRQSVKRLKELEKMRDEGMFEQMIKKEGLGLARNLEKLERNLGGVKDMGSLPDALFVIDVGVEKIAIQEANRLKIPVIGIVDTNNNPDHVDYIIPGNDDSRRSIELYLSAVADVINEARKSSQDEKAKDEFVEVVEEEVVTSGSSSAPMEVENEE